MPDKKKSNDERIDAVLARWPIADEEKLAKKVEVQKWLKKFEPSERDDMCSILEKVEVLSYTQIREWLDILSKELKKIFNNDFSAVRFFPLGNSPSASGANFLYHFRQELGISEACFPYKLFTEIDLTGIKALVFVDDMIGSGSQATRFFKKTLSTIPQNIDKYYVVLLAFKKGLNKVRKQAGFTMVIPATERSEEYKAFSSKSRYFTDQVQRERLKKICYNYGEQLYPEYPLGYEDSQSLFVFPHNVPNNTIPIIWAGPESESKPGVPWSPLWKRKKICAQTLREPGGKQQTHANPKPEITDKKQEMQHVITITKSLGTTVIQGNGNIINTNLPTTEKKPLSELYRTLANKYDEELKKDLK